MSTSRFRLQLFGPPALVGERGVPLKLGTRKALALLAYLAVEQKAVPRGELAALLWPENPEEQARASLRQELSRLGGILGPGLLSSGPQSVALSDELEVDLWQYKAALNALDLTTAIQLYRGPFLQGLSLREAASFETWQETTRTELQQSYLEALSGLASQEEAQGNSPQALAYRRQAIAADPLAEGQYLAAMELSERMGDRAGALRLYQALERILQEELGVSPGPAAQALAQRLTHEHQGTPELPSPPTPLVGRLTEAAEVLTLLERPDCRLLSLVGPGGVGKSRLALEVARRWREAATAVVWVALRGPQLWPALAEALGASSRGDIREALIGRLQEPLLLVLDEAEILLEPAEVEYLLRQTPLKLLATTRERLRLRSEWVYEVQGLRPPEPGEPPQQSPAAQLFWRSAQRVRPDFSPSAADWQAIGAICRLLSGLPLGLELAAAWARMMSCGEILAQLEQGLDLLEGSLTDLPERQRSLRVVLESSLERLSPHQRETLAQLAVFRGEFDLETTRKVAQATPTDLATLVDRALLQSVGGKYRLQEVLRQHLAPEVLPATHEAHARYYAGRLKAREQDMRGSDQPGALREFSGAYANLKAAWSWALGHEHPELACEMIDALFLLYELRGWFAEGVAVLEAATASPDPLLRSLALVRSGRLLYRLGQPGEARRALEQALESGGGHIDEYERAFALNNLGLTRMVVGDFAEARQLFEESLALRRQQRRPWGTANSLYNLGTLAWLSGEYEEAKARFQEGLELYRFLGDLRGMSLALTGLGQVWTSLGQYPVARELLRQSLSYGEQLGDHFAVAGALLGLGTVAGIERKNEECLDRLQASLEAARETGDKASIGRALLGLGRLALRESDPERAMKLARQALERFQEIRYRWGEALAYNHLGRTCLAIGEPQDARAYYRLALEEALRMGAMPLALRALAGMSPLLGDSLASSVRALVISHPAADAWVREEAKKQEVGDSPPLPTRGLEDVIQAVLKTL
ncbi:MAG TPA: tetratricopeptide repeat protein [Meiothermus sp.]|nr:tetratricopeptide repeat protein [Meiothermus sp.]